MNAPRAARLLSAGILAASLMALAVACGSRTGLFSDELAEGGPFPPPNPSALPDASRDAAVDRAVPEDALPPLDARVIPDVVQSDCPDAASTLVYVITTDNELFSFYPPDASFRLIGRIACPAPAGTTPFSMAVDRNGVAFVAFNDGNLYRISTLTAACTKTTFAPNQQGFSTFGMGFATKDLGPAESLFVAADNQSGPPRGLGVIDTTTFRLTSLGAFTPSIDRAELTGTGDGRLYGFYTKAGREGSFIGEIDKANARVVGETQLRTVDQGSGWAFASWGGDFYLFTAPDSPASRVTRYRPSDNSTTIVANLGTLVVGAGVSTCAPSQ
ncbi:MAG: hypothetical protein IPF92_15300 [Myxococcales bacterium]|nr:hypothetical protein [Myxococcales bacterium]MBL0195240.1 hypothetical protein [Myxococcales bacterium]HQY62415.1 hypothetical protein [Polyangiaceae bacterium]